LLYTPKVKQSSADYSFTVSKLYKTSFDAFSVAGPADITENVFYTARADEETDVSSCNTADCHHLVGVSKDSRDETRLEVKNGFK